MRLILLPIVALSMAATPALAEPACAPIGDIEAKLAAEYRETRVQQGVTQGGQAMLVIFAAPDGATWTAVMVRPDGVGCMAAAGDNWQTRSDPAPVQEQGS